MAPGDTLLIALYRSTDGGRYHAYTVGDRGNLLRGREGHSTRRGALETLLEVVERDELGQRDTLPVEAP